MGAVLTTFRDQPCHKQTVTLGGVQFQVRLTWRRRCGAWYLDLWAQDGTALALGRRISPGWGPLLGLSIPNGPAGYLFVRGSDPYGRDALGDDVRIAFYTTEEIAALVVDEDGPVVEITES
jgi:hypothetical protein